MNWTSPYIFLALLGSAHLQCFTNNDNFQGTPISTDLMGLTAFGTDLFQELSSVHSAKNLIFSPYSIWSALAMAYFGSAGTTESQLEVALRVKDKISAIRQWKALEILYKNRQRGNTDYDFATANRIYFNEHVQIRPCIMSILDNELHSLKSNDFAGSATEINTFVSNTTKGRINNIVSASNLRNAMMVLVNAVYFKGTWSHQFNPKLTSEQPFISSSLESSPVPMMAMTRNFRYGESRQLGARVLELPYAGEAMAMYVLLPDGTAENRFDSMINNLNSSTLREAISDLIDTEVDLRLPKFKLEYEVSTELKQALQNIGIEGLFSKLANLTTFAPAVSGQGVGKIIHKAFIEVNEEGTEAAAATSLITTYSAFEREIPVEFHCNQPFVYFIYDRLTGNVIFLGTVKSALGLSSAS